LLRPASSGPALAVRANFGFLVQSFALWLAQQRLFYQLGPGCGFHSPLGASFWFVWCFHALALTGSCAGFYAPFFKL
jgi:hypothetical protein